MGALNRNNVSTAGNGNRAMVFAHGYGCDKNMWRYVAPAFEHDFKTVLFDHVGSGQSDLSAYSREKYATLDGYANDVLELADELNLKDAVFVGHSVSSTIGILAAIKTPGVFSKLILIGPSPRYIDDGDYVGGFTAQQIEELLAFLDENYLGWSAAMAPAIMGNADRPELGKELENSFCRTDPEISKAFARVTFLSDNRDDYAKVQTPSLILQCSDDIIASDQVGEYLHRTMPASELVIMKATGHCPHLSHPAEVISEIRKFV